MQQDNNRTTYNNLIRSLDDIRREINGINIRLGFLKNNYESKNIKEICFNLAKSKSLLFFLVIYLFLFSIKDDSFNRFILTFYNSINENYKNLLIFIYNFSLYIFKPLCWFMMIRNLLIAFNDNFLSIYLDRYFYFLINCTIYYIFLYTLNPFQQNFIVPIFLYFLIYIISFTMLNYIKNKALKSRN